MLPATATIQKQVGETPLAALERFRASRPELRDMPIAYAGRLDPMASGTLLLLLGDECKQQQRYHDLDKTYQFSTLLGVSSDTGDILGRLRYQEPPTLSPRALRRACRQWRGAITLPYPHFSAKTVRGKPLHVWTLEGRLDEITIPTRASYVYDLRLQKLTTYTGEKLYERARDRIGRLPTVTAPSKALGQDFRRKAVLQDWEHFYARHRFDEYPVATFTCTASSGTYMRSLAERIAATCHTIGLAHHIHRTTLGRFHPIYGRLGFWTSRYQTQLER